MPVPCEAAAAQYAFDFALALKVTFAGGGDPPYPQTRLRYWSRATWARAADAVGWAAAFSFLEASASIRLGSKSYLASRGVTTVRTARSLTDSASRIAAGGWVTDGFSRASCSFHHRFSPALPPRAYAPSAPPLSSWTAHPRAVVQYALPKPLSAADSLSLLSPPPQAARSRASVSRVAAAQIHRVEREPGIEPNISEPVHRG